jgi:hypothetical protein
VYLIKVVILLDFVSSELMKLGPEGCHGSIVIKSVQSHDHFVHEGCNYLGFSLDGDFIIFSIGKQHGFGLIGEAVIETVPHLFIVLCCLFVCIDACGKDERLATCFECVGINLAVFSKEADFPSCLPCLAIISKKLQLRLPSC